MKSKKSKRILAALLAALAFLPACAREEAPSEAEPYGLRAAVGGSLETLDPGRADGETVLCHLYENLLRWEDGGGGWAAPVPGQAERWEMETDYAGNATYTFTLREDACWSDGKPVAAEDFVTAWRRLADPDNHLPHRELLSIVSGYAAAAESGDMSALAVSAPDRRTLIVTLEGNPAWFLAEVCAGAYTMPLREDLRESWDTGAVTNGPYTAAEWTPSLARLERSATYYGLTGIGPEELYFVPAGSPEADYGSFTAGELDLTAQLPDGVLEEMAEDWVPEPVTAGYAVLLNTAAPPFDSLDIRTAFRLAVDPAGLELGPLVQPAEGLVPFGVADYGELPERQEGDVLCRDFRTHSRERVTMPEAGDYEENCRLARRLLAQAGYPGGDGFPVVEYVYVDEGQNGAVAQALRRMWQEQLGVAVKARGLSRTEYDTLVVPAPKTGPGDAGEDAGEAGDAPDVFQMAGWSYSAAYDDAAALLEFWQSGDNPTGYASEAFQLVMEAARTASGPDARDGLLHDAEALLLEDGPVIPVYYSGGSYALAEKWTGLFRRPDGVYFLYHVTAA